MFSLTAVLLNLGHDTDCGVLLMRNEKTAAP